MSILAAVSYLRRRLPHLRELFRWTRPVLDHLDIIDSLLGHVDVADTCEYR